MVIFCSVSKTNRNGQVRLNIPSAMARDFEILSNPESGKASDSELLFDRLAVTTREDENGKYLEVRIPKTA